MTIKYKSVDTDTLYRLFSFNNCIIIDIRTPLEYALGHIPHSLNIPLQTLLKAPMLYINPNYEYYIICKNGQKSIGIVKHLSDLNYPVINVNGGLKAWKGPIQKDRCFN